MEDLLKKAILFAQNPINIPPKSIKVIFNFHKSLMYHNKDAWVKKYASVELDVTMGSHDSYGLCRIFELLMLNMLRKLFEKQIHRFRKTVVGQFSKIVT